MGSQKLVLRLFFVLLVLLAACAPAPPPQPPPVVLTTSQAPAPSRERAMEGAIEEGAMAARGGAELPALPAPGTAVPVGLDDPFWGNPFAPVTMVVWGDYECPFTSKLMATLVALKAKYGPERLRIVWRHNPLPFHKNARPTHVAAETVLRLGGLKAFWKFHDLAFANQRSLTPEMFEAWAVESGVNRAAFRAEMEQGGRASKIDSDLAAGKVVGVSGTPSSFINGIRLSGAQPLYKFEEVIDGALVEAEALRRSGVPADRIYAQLSEKNYSKEPPPAPEAPDTTVWQVPIDGSPVRGPANALVTIVMFGDFQCPFCAKVVPTLSALETKYPGKLRIVFKHNPLPMHPRAAPSAQLAIEAGVQKGEATFWKAFDLLFANQQHLEDADLEGYAKTLGLDVARAKKAMESRRHRDRINGDQALADDLLAAGTPHFFINGRRLVGAQSIEKFEALIDEQMAIAAKLVSEGTKPEKVYEALQKGAKTAAPPERVVLPAPTKANPGKGAALGAPVVVQIFGDFQCPFCKRAQESLDELIKAHPGKVRVVWRHFPLRFHREALLAAEASVEAFKQKGDVGFWAFAKLLFEDQSPAGLGRDAILKKAAEAGLDVAKLEAALDAHTHRAAVQADADLGARFGFTGTPMIVVGDYFISGAQPFPKLDRYVKKSLGPHEPIAPGTSRAENPKAKADLEPAPAAAAASQPSSPSAPLMGAKHLLVMYAGSKRAPASITRTKDEARIRAEEARKKVLAGARFEDVVATYSDEPGAAGRGGDLGTFPKGAMMAPFQKALEALSVGQVSEVVETDFGFHVILRTQ